MVRENVVVSKSVEFALQVISFCGLLESNRRFVIANQLLKAGTSIGAKIYEAQNAESKADFVHKMKVAAKEIEETKYWLLLCEKSPAYPFNHVLKDKINELGLLFIKL